MYWFFEALLRPAAPQKRAEPANLPLRVPDYDPIPFFLFSTNGICGAHTQEQGEATVAAAGDAL